MSATAGHRGQLLEVVGVHADQAGGEKGQGDVAGFETIAEMLRDVVPVIEHRHRVAMPGVVVPVPGRSTPLQAMCAYARQGRSVDRMILACFVLGLPRCGGRQASTARPRAFPASAPGSATRCRYFAAEFASPRLVCVDGSHRSASIVRGRFSRSGEFRSLRWPSAVRERRLDVVFTGCVFHHISHHDYVSIFREMRQVLTPAGDLFVLEHNPRNTLTVHAVRTCPFDENARLIFSPAARLRQTRRGSLRRAASLSEFPPTPWTLTIPQMPGETKRSMRLFKYAPLERIDILLKEAIRYTQSSDAVPGQHGQTEGLVWRKRL
jgi:hypothetical protein